MQMQLWLNSRAGKQKQPSEAPTRWSIDIAGRFPNVELQCLSCDHRTADESQQHYRTVGIPVVLCKDVFIFHSKLLIIFNLVKVKQKPLPLVLLLSVKHLMKKCNNRMYQWIHEQHPTPSFQWLVMKSSWDWKTFITSLTCGIQHFAEQCRTCHNKMHFIAV